MANKGIRRKEMKKEEPKAAYLCATVELFDIQVVLAVGDREECAKLIRRDRAKDYTGPDIGEGFLVGLKKIDEYSETRNGYSAVTLRVTPGIIIYAPKPITLGLLVHEISHAANMIMHIVGSECDELRAYLCRYLFDQLAVKDCEAIHRYGE